MKSILIMCLLGMSTLLPSNEAKCNSIIKNLRVVDVTITGWVLYATSDAEDGEITRIEIWQNGERVRYQNCTGDFDCSISLSGLSSGTYTAKVICKHTTYTEPFAM